MEVNTSLLLYKSLVRKFSGGICLTLYYLKEEVQRLKVERAQYMKELRQYY